MCSRSRLLAPVEALVTIDAVSALPDPPPYHLHHHHQRLYQQQQPDVPDDVSDSASSLDDAASELSDEDTASVIEVAVGRTDQWSDSDIDYDQSSTVPRTSSLFSNYIFTANQSLSLPSTDQGGPPTSVPAASDDSVLRRRTEYIQTAPWRCLPIRHLASIASYSDPDIASSAAAASELERQRLARARQRRHLARSTEVSQSQPLQDKALLSTSSAGVALVQSTPVTSHLESITTTTVNGNQQQRPQAGVSVVVSRSSYVPQKPPPPLPMPENELVKQLRPVQSNNNNNNNNSTTKPSNSLSSSTSSSSSSSREKQIPVRELVAQLSGGQIPATTTTLSTEQQQQRRQQRRQQLQLLHGRPLSSSSSDAEADYEIFINTPPAAATTKHADDNREDRSV